MEEREWPRDSRGVPMVRISMVISEKIPTGQYANVDCGPAAISAFIPIDKPNPFSERDLKNITSGINQLAEALEYEVLAVQRANILQSVQNAVKSGGSVTQKPS